MPMPNDGTDSTHGLKIIPPHALPNQLRICYRGTLTQEEAQARLGGAYRVLELCPAQCLSEDETSNQLVAATEVIFAKTSEETPLDWSSTVWVYKTGREGP